MASDLNLCVQKWSEIAIKKGEKLFFFGISSLRKPFSQRTRDFYSKGISLKLVYLNTFLKDWVPNKSKKRIKNEEGKIRFDGRNAKFLTYDQF